MLSFRANPITLFSITEYLRQIGTDEMISLVDGWGPDDPNVPLHLDEWSPSQLDHPIGLLLGGVGDGKFFPSSLSFVLRLCIYGG